MSFIAQFLVSSGFWPVHEWSLKECSQLNGKIAIVTGGQSGFGIEIVSQLLLHDIEKVVVIARDETKFCDAKANKWSKLAGVKLDSEKLEFVRCDLADTVAINKVAEGLLRRLKNLDMLFCNAGTPTIPEYILSPQGIESIFAANHIGHFVLTTTLLPLLSAALTSRIVITTSSLHSIAQTIDFESLSSPTRTKSPAAFDSLYRYGRSKLAGILFTRELAKRVPSNIYVNCFFPGNIPTGAMDTWKQLVGPLGAVIKGMFWILGNYHRDAATTALFLGCAGKVVEGEGIRGKYFVPVAHEEETNAAGSDMELAGRLWQWTEDFLANVLPENDRQ